MKSPNYEAIELQGNPVSRANEEDAIQQHGRLSHLFQTSPQKRNNLRRKSTILGSSKKNAFENSRITRLYFERYRVLELGRMWTICASIVLMILEYEVSFAYQLKDIYQEEIKTLLYLILFLTIISIIMTLMAYLAELEFKKRSLTVPNASNIFQTNLIFLLLIETTILLPCPTPYTIQYKVSFSQRYSDQPRFYFVNEILTFVMLFRTLLILNIAFKFQPFYSNRVNRLCGIYQVEFGPHFIFKVMIREHPYSTLFGLFCIGIFLFSYQLEISERSLLRTTTEIDHYNINNSLWVCMITIFTVGYGDIYPTTELGRLAMTLGLFYGVALTSLFTAILYADLQPFVSELRSITLLDKTNIKMDIRQVAERILLNFYKLNTYLHKYQVKNSINDPATLNRVSQIQALLQEGQQLKRNYRSIDNEDFIAMTDRYFKDMNNRIKDFRDMLQKMKYQQLSINKSETPRMRSIQKQCHTITAASYDVKSKDDQYFEQLIDSESNNQQLMQFNDDE
ncbi:unnamed protein product [Paramecium pentaurelia]|uniref:Potassium channel domain-containing protein n=1 Tax=Paramecium pentaurelia TaxID=43138 RepID=A0A8S1U8C9_9CILI|nr:unnamed protein product [Paramecium pentaurelia]